jgi:hypothetical protein
MVIREGFAAVSCRRQPASMKDNTVHINKTKPTAVLFILNPPFSSPVQK